MDRPGPQPLPREIQKWLQSLDLSLKISNPKRDLCNGFVIAEIVSRFFPKDIDMNTFENGNRLAAKCDNWEQLYKVFRKKQLGIQKHDFDVVIHAAPDAAVHFLFKIYCALTKRPMPKIFQPADVDPPVPAFMRDTAAWRLKDHEIDRVQDKVEKTIRAIDTLGGYHEERKHVKSKEAEHLVAFERRRKQQRPDQQLQAKLQDELQESMQIDEVRVKAMAPMVVPGGQKTRDLQQAKAKKAEITPAPRSAVGALAGMQQPALFVKPAADIMRPLVAAIIQESEELVKIVDTQKDVVVSFMEHCRDGLPEDISVRVFETLANRAQLLVDTLTKSPPEFWKVWSHFFPALTDFIHASPVFECAVNLFKRIGDLMREADPTLTQQLITEVGLPSLGKELVRSPEKRDMLCEIIYSYTQEDTLNHLLVLRALKEKVRSTELYISCLACLVSLDAQLSLLDEHLLDLYIYYALIAMQSPQPKVRVAGVSILSTITTCSSQFQSIAVLVPQFMDLANDDWWEVQAQVLMLSASLLSKVSSERHLHEENRADQERDAEVSHSAGSDGGEGEDAITQQLLEIIGRLFVISNSKNLLQVGLSALVHLLSDHPTLLPVFVTVLLEQGPEMRQRLLRPQEPQDHDRLARQAYVMGNASRMYEEKCVSELWPHLDVAKTFVMQLEASPPDQLEKEHMEVFLASLPAVEFDPEEGEEWVQVFEKVQQYIIIALVDPELHIHSVAILRRFWLAAADFIQTRSLELSKRSLLQALLYQYGDTSDGRVRISEGSLLDFIREIHDVGGMPQIEISSVVESFREVHPTEFENSKLDTIFG